MIEVAAAWIFDGKRVLLCRRPAHKARGGHWEFPGGKLEKGENAAMALEREIMEELAVTIRAGKVAADVVCQYPDISIHLTLLEAEITAGEPQALEHSALQWVLPEELAEYDLCTADRRLVEKMNK